jgi:hypothetical protein
VIRHATSPVAKEPFAIAYPVVLRANQIRGSMTEKQGLVSRDLHMMLRRVRGDPKLGPVSWEVRRPWYRVVAIYRVLNAAGFPWPEGLESGLWRSLTTSS